MKRRVAYFNIDDVMIGEHGDLDVSFDVTYQGNTIVPLPSRFTIDNLKQDTINYIATNTALFQGRSRHIKFFCGYDDNVKMIFDGEISKAQPYGQPDKSLMIEAWTSTEVMGTNITAERKNITYEQLITEAAHYCGLSCSFSAGARNSAKIQQVIEYFSHTGSEYDFLRRVMSDVTGFNVVKDQVLFCINKNTLFVSLADEVNSLLPVVEISANNGLIGLPEPNVAGVDLRVLLNVSFSCGQTIRLKSKTMPLYNGLYNIYGITHHGSIRSNEFYTDLVCQRVYGQGEYGASL